MGILLAYAWINYVSIRRPASIEIDTVVAFFLRFTDPGQ